MASYLRSVWLLAFVLLLVALPVFAHHGAASVYDPNNKITLKGTVTRLLWANPHVEVYFDAPDPVTGEDRPLGTRRRTRCAAPVQKRLDQG